MKRPKYFTKADIEYAHKRTRSNHAAARLLGCSYQHYRKYSKLYIDEESGLTLHELHKNQSGKGIPKFISNRGKDPDIKALLRGELPLEHYSPAKIRDRLITEGLIEDCCNNCKFRERRVLDNKVPLLMHFKDNNKKNWMLKNIQLLCYNCYFLYVGNIFDDKQLKNLEDFSFSEKKSEVKWEIDQHYIEHLRHLGLEMDKPSDDGSEYISRL